MVSDNSGLSQTSVLTSVSGPLGVLTLSKYICKHTLHVHWFPSVRLLGTVFPVAASLPV